MTRRPEVCVDGVWLNLPSFLDTITSGSGAGRDSVVK